MKNKNAPSWKRALDVYKKHQINRMTYEVLAAQYDVCVAQIWRDVGKIEDLMYSNARDWEWDYENLEKLMATVSKYISDKSVLRFVRLVIFHFHSPKQILDFDGSVEVLAGMGVKFESAMANLIADKKYRKTYLEVAK